MPLDRYLGPCRVVRVPPQPLIEPRHLEGIDLSHPRRLLFRSESVRDRRAFPERFTAISPELAALLVEKGILLVGMDTRSTPTTPCSAAASPSWRGWCSTACRRGSMS